MEKKQIEGILNSLLDTGADFAEVFLEDKKQKDFRYIDSRLEKYNINSAGGIGLRIAKKNDVYYASLSTYDLDEINKTVDKLKNNIKDNIIYHNVKLDPLKVYSQNAEENHSDEDLKNLFQEIDKKIRAKDARVSQVTITYQNILQDVIIANHQGRYVKENRVKSRIFIYAYFQDKDLRSNAYYSKGMSLGNDFLFDLDYDKIIDDIIQMGIDKLYAKPCKGGVMPVIIESGFGGVVFHEACGHALEATSVANGLSVLSSDLNKKIASSKVTLIDDGTIADEWGSTLIDDEGKETQKNILIENGILKGYLIDEINTRKMNMPATGSSRRENYTYAPTSRMNNTYLAPGNDTLNDMFKSIKLGLYAKALGGGCVNPTTGDFNFACNVAYMIRDGKIAECVTSASLIGNTKEILANVEMVSDNLELGQGVCGSISGNVPINVGEPTIKISAILVGGEASD